MSDGVFGDAGFKSSYEDFDAIGLASEEPDGLMLGGVISVRNVTIQPEPTAKRTGLLGAFATPEAPKVERQRFYTPVCYRGERHLCLVAPTRTGKGTTVIVPTLLSDKSSFIVSDPKGQNAAITLRCRRDILGQKCFVLNPFGLHDQVPWNLPHHHFNPLDAVDPKSPNFVAEITALGEALIKTESKNDPHWADGARDLCTGLMIHVKTWGAGTSDAEIPTLPRVRELLTLPEDQFLNLMRNIIAKGHPAAQARLGRFDFNPENDNKEIQGVLSEAITQTSFLDDPAIRKCMADSDFSFADMKKTPTTVYIVLPARFMEAYSRWTRLIMQSAIDAMIATPKGHPVVAMLDESFSLLGRARLPVLEHAMAMAAGHGLRIWTVWQDINQMKQIFGDTWQTFLANSGVMQFFTPADAVTAGHLSERLGTFTVGYATESMGEISKQQAAGGFTGIQRSQQYASRPLAFPHELYGFPTTESLIFVAGKSDGYRSQRLPYWDLKTWFEGRYDPDPYHS